ncbi:hypothetical protein HMPREF2617_05065 [Corynebacterium sp. HMSC070H05]|uniref:hypothetical protein n=1 Tax=Corynebacterium sp. HMSC070H05 TaxID=1715096 RepID=UPI0008A8771D|nr:hypothetical protein [Corynebacterium sp. HMSC070H05]OHQ55966.1 hypothetical protein HMPREF2617_05065 [Corynebacterium sp. HMSC070H05]
MIWQGATLLDDSRTRATATADTITVGGAHPSAVLRITAGSARRFKAVDADTGGEFVLRKAGFTVARYTADCDGRRYTLNRSGLHREIRDAAGTLVAVTRGKASGDLHVEVKADVDAAAEADLPMEDLVFMTWALTFVDTPTRRTRI